MNPFYETLDYTILKNGYTCIKEFYPAHIISTYLIMLSGLACFITRIPLLKLSWTHIYFGRLYIISMIFGLATSLLIHNTGLPTGVIVWCRINADIFCHNVDRPLCCVLCDFNPPVCDKQTRVTFSSKDARGITWTC